MSTAYRNVASEGDGSLTLLPEASARLPILFPLPIEERLRYYFTRAYLRIPLFHPWDAEPEEFSHDEYVGEQAFEHYEGRR
jgi:hypothetical protein